MLFLWNYSCSSSFPSSYARYACSFTTTFAKYCSLTIDWLSRQNDIIIFAVCWCCEALLSTLAPKLINSGFILFFVQILNDMCTTHHVYTYLIAAHSNFVDNELIVLVIVSWIVSSGSLWVRSSSPKRELTYLRFVFLLGSSIPSSILL